MEQIQYSKKFVEKTFRGTTMKDAYLRASKWYASSVLSKNLEGVQVEYIKSPKAPEITVKVYAMLPEEDIFEEHCNCCKEMHKSFFINEKNDCNRCSMLGYRNRMVSKVSTKASYCKEHSGE